MKKIQKRLRIAIENTMETHQIMTVGKPDKEDVIAELVVAVVLLTLMIAIYVVTPIKLLELVIGRFS